ncbi:MAG: glucoamylase family protein [Cytophagales bacterium]|nr:glucoamylase family protein [Cytophagales bacterium]
MRLSVLPFFTLLVFLFHCGDDTSNPTVDIFQLSALRVGTLSILNTEVVDAPLDQPIVCSFSKSLDQESVESALEVVDSDGIPIDFTISYLDENRTLSLLPTEILIENSTYTLTIENSIRATDGSRFLGITTTFRTINTPLTVVSSQIDGQDVGNERIVDISFTPEIKITFSEAVTISDVESEVSIVRPGLKETPIITQEDDNTLVFNFEEAIEGYQKFRFKISANVSVDNRPFEEYDFEFYTKLDSTLKFPEISDDALLSQIQEQTFKYFYDFAHPFSGLARESNSSGDIVTIGGSGFGLMAIIVAIERGFISREEGINRLDKIINFLADADRFHGVWPHWLNGNNGTVIPFSPSDDGADLVETAFLLQGLLTVRQYLDDQNDRESAMINSINTLWHEVEWNWFQQEGDNYLTWHWSPNVGFNIDLPIRGWNESLMVYLLAASSSTHTIDNSVYTEGWARSGGMMNGNEFFGITLPLGETRGGPLFYSHYSFLGLDPRNLQDRYAHYWDQNVAHSKINQSYCTANPKNYVGYGSHSWGITASNNIEGYFAHSPTQDRGVIAPTAAISSLPYTPEESMAAIRHFYYILGDKLWGPYGFYDAFNVTEGWYADSYLAIDQGPIVCMIENHRTGLLWDLFMSAPEIQMGLDKLGFTY